MENFERPGDVQTFTPPVGGVTSGGVYQIGQALGVAGKTVTAAEALAGATCGLKIRGVFTVTKVGSQAWTEGALVYWDDGNTRFTTDPTGNRLAGWATEAIGAGAGETTGHVYLDGVARENEAT
jgi:predicted RecA/RadA family phage recombinase